jgi:putative hydrolase of the HAD superfamily
MSNSANARLRQRIKELSHPLNPQATDIEPALPRLCDTRAVLFDIYGTLMISASGDIGLEGGANRIQAFAEALSTMGIADSGKAHSEQGPRLLKAIIETHHKERRAAGIEFPEVDILLVWRQLCEQLGLRLEANQIRRLSIEYECRVNPVWPMPGLSELLAYLRTTPLQLGIVSNAQFYTPLLFEALLGRDLNSLGFSEAYCVWSYQQLEAKPSTRLYAKALQALEDAGVEPQQVLYIGNDQRNDVWPAAAMGCRTLLFAGDKRSLRLREDESVCRRKRPDGVITTLQQLPGLLA